MNWTRAYIGIPFVAGGKSTKGTDCFGLVRMVLTDIFNADMSKVPDPNVLECDIEHAGILFCEHRKSEQWCEVLEPKAGDVILFRVHRFPAHCGLVLNKTHMLHIQPNTNSCIDRYTGMKWVNRILGYYRHLSMVEVGND